MKVLGSMAVLAAAGLAALALWQGAPLAGDEAAPHAAASRSGADEHPTGVSRAQPSLPRAAASPWGAAGGNGYFMLDDAGRVVADGTTASLLEQSIADHCESDCRAIEREFLAGLAPAQAAQARGFIASYLQYAAERSELYAQAGPLDGPDAQRARHQQVERMQQSMFGAESIRLFGDENERIRQLLEPAREPLPNPPLGDTR